MPGSQGKEAVKNRHFLSTEPSGSRMGLEKSGVGHKFRLWSVGGTGPGLLHLQQSLNKSRMSGAEVRGGWAGREGAASVQLVGRTQILQAQDSGLPFFWGPGAGPACGQADVPDLLPSRPLHGPGQFLTSSESEVDGASRPRSGIGSNVVLDWLG